VKRDGAYAACSWAAQVTLVVGAACGAANVELSLRSHPVDGVAYEKVSQEKTALH